MMVKATKYMSNSYMFEKFKKIPSYKQTFVFFNSATWTVLPQKVRMTAVQQVSLLVLVKLEYFISLLLTEYVEQLLS